MVVLVRLPVLFFKTDRLNCMIFTGTHILLFFFFWIYPLIGTLSVVAVDDAPRLLLPAWDEITTVSGPQEGRMSPPPNDSPRVLLSLFHSFTHAGHRFSVPQLFVDTHTHMFMSSFTLLPMLATGSLFHNFL
jgi:hypothetical protein